MAHQSGSARFQALFEPALQAYEQTTGVSLTQHPLAVKLQGCESVEAITGLLQDQAQAFRNFQGSDKIMESLKTIVSILSKLSSTASLAVVVHAFGLTFTPAKAIEACLAILLNSAKGIVSNCDALVDLLESIEQFLNRLNNYTLIPATSAIGEIVVKILVGLIPTLALVTEELKQRRSIKFVKRFFKEKDIEAVLEGLDRLAQDEARTTATHTLTIVHGLVQHMREFMNDGNAPIDDVREDLKILHQMAGDTNKSRRDEILSKIRSWLAPPDPWKNYNIGRESRHSETGAWFVNSNTLSEWKASGSSSLLWIHGKPGAGKSVLCSTVIEGIEDMQKSGLASLAMFFYDSREKEKTDLRGLLSSVLFQLCNQSYSYYSILSTLYSAYDDGSRIPSNDELVRCLKDLLNLPGQAPVYLIVDALDECPNTSMPSHQSHRDQVLGLLKDLVDSKFPNLRICVTSRPESDIKLILEPLTFRSVSLHDESGQKEDIETYIRSIVNTDRRMRRWTSVHKQLVIDVLTERADGIFESVHCQLEYLARCLPGRIRDALDEYHHRHSMQHMAAP